MPTLYNAQNVTDTIDKTLYERAHRVELHNPLNKLPFIEFYTSWVEKDNETGEETQKEMKRTLREHYNPAEAFNVMDADGNVIGQATYEQLFGLLYGLFFYVAAKEDS